jgi:acyl dehydratase
MLQLPLFETTADGTIGVSGWRTVSQTRINQFAQSTDDYQFIHVDPVRAKREADFGGTIAHGFLTLSLISSLATDIIPRTADLKAVMIVGIDKVKFVAPVPSGSRVRGQFKLIRSHQMGETRLLLKVGVVVEMDGGDKPVLTCEVTWIAEMARAYHHDPVTAETDHAMRRIA